MQEKTIEVVVGEPELPKLLNGKLRLKRDGILYLFDDEVEYGSRYKFVLTRRDGGYELEISEEGADEEWYKYGTIRFNDVKELETVDNLLWKYCRERKFMRDSEWRLLEQYVEFERQALCGVINYVKMQDIGRRLVSIGLKLGIF